MTDLKLKLEKLFADAADCQLLGGLSADRKKRAAYRRRAEEFRDLALRVRLQIGEQPHSDIQFLLEQARICRSLATSTTDDMQQDLLALAQELEQAARKERGEG